MGFYDKNVVPYCIELACGLHELDPARESSARALHGTVLEIGFGSGMNVPFYPAAVEKVLAVDPSSVARRIGRKRIAQARCPIEDVGLDAERLALNSGVADCALSTFTLCSIPDVQSAVREVKRVLKPGGRLYFAEHGRSPEPGVARWQDRFTPLQRALFGGCHLNRDVREILEHGGFRVERLETSYVKGAPRSHGYLSVGVAVAS
jgi:ubiquinone/menaquinone biosynthesis C-methylase UbiE